MTALKWGCKKTKKEIAQHEHENLIHHKGKENNSRRKLFFFQMIFFLNMSSSSCACHIMKLVRSFFLKSQQSSYGWFLSWPTCFQTLKAKKSTNRPPIKSQMFLIKAGSWHEDVVVGDWFETCKRWASCWLKSSLLFTDTCSAPTGFHCVLAQSFIRHWVSKHTMHRLKTVHTPQNPEIIWYLFVCLFFRKDIRTKLIL